LEIYGFLQQSALQMLTLRPECKTDHQAIHAVNAAAFPSDLEARLVDALRAAGRLVVSHVAELGGQVVGHVAFSPVTVNAETRPSGGIGLGPAAVAPAFQRRGIGMQLIRAGIEVCRQGDFKFIVVLGDPAYYRRFGFAKASAIGLQNEYGADEEFMVLALKPAALADIKGLVKYAPEFALVA
jgi:putative acetyltransferase